MLRQKILDEALQLVAREGFERITMRALAARLGYSPATIYLYFRSKDDLLEEIARCGFELLTESTRPATQIADLHGAILEAGRRYLDFAVENPALYRLMFHEIDLTRWRDAPEEMPGRELYDQYRDMFARGAAAGAAGDLDPELQTLIGWSAVHGFAMLALSGRLPPARMPGRSVFELRDLFLRFLAAATHPGLGSPDPREAR